MSEGLVPQSSADDDDDVVISLETARALETRGERKEAARWLQRAAGAARKQSRPERAGQLSRLAARLLGDVDGQPRSSSKFEPLEEEAQVLRDAEDDEFSDKTIVDEVQLPPSEQVVELVEDDDTQPQATALDPPAPPVAEAPSPPQRPAAEAREKSSRPRVAVLERPTPVAPLAVKKDWPVHQSLRVAVRKSLGGKLEARPLSVGEEAGSGEEEALLVPLRPGARLS